MKTIYTTLHHGEYKVNISEKILSLSREAKIKVAELAKQKLWIPQISITIKGHPSLSVLVKQNELTVIEHLPDGYRDIADEKNLLDLPKVYFSSNFLYSLADPTLDLSIAKKMALVIEKQHLKSFFKIFSEYSRKKVGSFPAEKSRLLKLAAIADRQNLEGLLGTLQQIIVP